MRALKRLPHRDWATLRDLWVDHLPQTACHIAYPQPTLWQLPPLHVPHLDAAGTAELPYVDGVREAILREVIVLGRKLIYCGTLLPVLAKMGKNTWTAVIAYETSFYGAKALCYLLGFASLGRSSNLYVDAFHETERKVGREKKKFYDSLRVHKLDERLTHDVLWSLTSRCIETTNFDKDLDDARSALRLIDWSEYSAFRNKIFYDGGFWPLSANMADCDIIIGRPSTDIIAAAELDMSPQSTPFAAEYFRASSLFVHLIREMFMDIAKIAPSFEAEVGAFDAI